MNEVKQLKYMYILYIHVCIKWITNEAYTLVGKKMVFIIKEKLIHKISNIFHEMSDTCIGIYWIKQIKDFN